MTDWVKRGASAARSYEKKAIFGGRFGSNLARLFDGRGGNCGGGGGACPPGQAGVFKPPAAVAAQQAQQPTPAPKPPAPPAAGASNGLSTFGLIPSDFQERFAQRSAGGLTQANSDQALKYYNEHYHNNPQAQAEARKRWGGQGWASQINKPPAEGSQLAGEPSLGSARGGGIPAGPEAPAPASQTPQLYGPQSAEQTAEAQRFPGASAPAAAQAPKPAGGSGYDPNTGVYGFSRPADTTTSGYDAATGIHHGGPSSTVPADKQTPEQQGIPELYARKKPPIPEDYYNFNQNAPETAEPQFQQFNSDTGSYSPAPASNEVAGNGFQHFDSETGGYSNTPPASPTATAAPTPAAGPTSSVPATDAHPFNPPGSEAARGPTGGFLPGVRADGQLPTEIQQFPDMSKTSAAQYPALANMINPIMTKKVAIAKQGAAKLNETLYNALTR